MNLFSEKFLIKILTPIFGILSVTSLILNDKIELPLNHHEQSRRIVPYGGS
jgi:hypothetical protein